MSERNAIFISYRRDDARGASGRLYDWLRIAFGREQVFRDVASLGAGRWRQKIDAALARSCAVVAVIGPRWGNTDNLPRLADPTDLVRHELLTALGDGDLAVVLPTLVEGFSLRDVGPLTAQLPTELRPLFGEWNAIALTDEGWEDDTRRIIHAIADETGLNVGPDLDTLLRHTGQAIQRLAEIEQERNFQRDQIDALRRTVDELTAKLADEPANRAPLAEALAALGRGETRQAEDAFEAEYDLQIKRVDAARKAQADAARNVANLAMLWDVNKAVAFYRKALEVEPEHTESWRQLGIALNLAGNLGDARKAFKHSLTLATETDNAWGCMAALDNIGDTDYAEGRLSNATSNYREALAIAEALATRDLVDTDWQRGLLVSHSKIGDVFVAQGDGPGAIAAYRKSLAIAESLTTRAPTNIEWQRDLSAINEKIGQVLIAQGDGTGGRAAYRKSLAIREALAALDPANTQWQRDLAISHEKIGDTILTQGDGPGTLAAYCRSLAIAKSLAARDLSNTEWQRDLSVCRNKIGDILLVQGDGPSALATYRKSLAIAESLTARDSTNTDWQRDLSVCHDKVGDALLAQGDESKALAAYRRSLAIREHLAVRDPANTQWQRDLSVCHNKIGGLLLAAGNGPDALAAYHQSLAIFETLAIRSPTNTEWQRDLSVSHERIGDVLLAQGDVHGALAAYNKDMAITESLAARDPANTEWQRDLSVCQNKIGDALFEQGDRLGALAAYRKSLAIRAPLAARAPANTEWQTDMAISCGKLGCHPALGIDARRDYLRRGQAILRGLKDAGRLLPSQDWTNWFERELAKLPK